MPDSPRPDGRALDALRPVRLEPGIAPHAAGSVLCAFGQTQVICAASWEESVPRWMEAQKESRGWMTAEYSMLPYSTTGRKPRDSAKGKVDGRSVEIQRLIGRSLRAVADLTRIPGRSLWLDCDVLQADGGTRTAAITGAYVAARLAVRKLQEEGAENVADPFREPVAAISVGIVDGTARLDLPYVEDAAAEVDMNVVMTASGRFVEVQASGEEATFDRTQLDQLLALAEKGIRELIARQKEALGEG